MTICKNKIFFVEKNEDDVIVILKSLDKIVPVGVVWEASVAAVVQFVTVYQFLLRQRDQLVVLDLILTFYITCRHEQRPLENNVTVTWIIMFTQQKKRTEEISKFVDISFKYEHNFNLKIYILCTLYIS